jgi:hypothetical protein
VEDAVVFILTIPMTSGRLKTIKVELTRALSEVKSSHRCEAIARGLGFSTYASALAATKSGTVGTAEVRGERFVTYLAEHGFKVSAKPFYNVAAKAALGDVAKRVPNLTLWGRGVGGPRRKSDGRWEDFREMNANFVQQREALVGDDAVAPFLASLALLTRVIPTKTIRSGTSITVANFIDL